MICSKCGSKSKADSSFCGGCGSALPQKSELKTKASSGNSLSQGSAKTNKTLSTGQIIAVSAAGMVLLAGVGVGAIILLSGGSSGDAQVSQQDSTQQIAAEGTYGSNSYLDLLWDRCENGNFESCDTLFLESPAGSEYEEFGDTCGNRNEAAEYCVDIYSSSGGSSAYGSYGSDSYLDSLWDNCSAGDFDSCDTLYFDSPSGSEYEEFGDTCGYRNEPSGYCADIYN